MKFLLVILSLLVIGCEGKRSAQLPKVEVTTALEIKVKELGLRIQKIDEKEVITKLDEQKALDFQQRLQELRKSYNKTSVLVKENYQDGDKEKLKLEYDKTEGIWDYIVFNFPI